MLVDGHAHVNDFPVPVVVWTICVDGGPSRNFVRCRWKNTIVEVPVIGVTEQIDACGQVIYGRGPMRDIKCLCKGRLEPAPGLFSLQQGLVAFHAWEIAARVVQDACGMACNEILQSN